MKSNGGFLLYFWKGDENRGGKEFGKKIVKVEGFCFEISEIIYLSVPSAGLVHIGSSCTSGWLGSLIKENNTTKEPETTCWINTTALSQRILFRVPKDSKAKHFYDRQPLLVETRSHENRIQEMKEIVHAKIEGQSTSSILKQTSIEKYMLNRFNTWAEKGH